MHSCQEQAERCGVKCAQLGYCLFVLFYRRCCYLLILFRFESVAVLFFGQVCVHVALKHIYLSRTHQHTKISYFLFLLASHIAVMRLHV